MEKFKLTRRGSKETYFEGTLKECYYRLFETAPGGNAWRELSEYGSTNILNPDGTMHERDYDEHEKFEALYRKEMFFKRQKCLVDIVNALGWEPINEETEGQAAGRYYPDNMRIGARSGKYGIILSIGYESKGKAVVLGEYPTISGYFATHLPYPKITVSYDRDPVKVAKDITRRFLPEYLKAFDEHESWVKDQNDYRSSLLDAMRRIKGRDLSQDEIDRKKVYDGLPEGVSVDYVCPEDARIDVRASIDECVKIIAFIRELESARPKTVDA